MMPFDLGTSLCAERKLLVSSAFVRRYNPIWLRQVFSKRGADKTLSLFGLTMAFC